MLRHEIEVLCAPTAFGKTVTAAAIIAGRGVNTLILAHRTELLTQWQERLGTLLDDAENPVGVIGGGKHKPTGQIDIAHSGRVPARFLEYAASRGNRSRHPPWLPRGPEGPGIDRAHRSPRGHRERSPRYRRLPIRLAWATLQAAARESDRGAPGTPARRSACTPRYREADRRGFSITRHWIRSFSRCRSHGKGLCNSTPAGCIAITRARTTSGFTTTLTRVIRL